MATLAAIDLGAQSGRVALGRFDGQRLDISVVHRFANNPVRVRGTLYWDILRLYQDALDGLRAAGREAGGLDSLGVDSWAVDFGLVDRRGRLVQNPVHYRDSRRAGALDEVLGRVGCRKLYDRTGIQILPINTIFELAAMSAEQDPALAAAETLLMVPDLLNYWLSGSQVTEFTNATTTQLLDARTGAWCTDLLDCLGIRSGLLPEIVQPGTPLGEIAADVRAETGISGSKVVAVGSHDTASAVVAVPFRRPGSAYISVGTWSLVGVERAEPVIDERTFAMNLTNEGGVAGTYRLLRNVTGLWLLHECRKTWALSGRNYGFEELMVLAETAPALKCFIEPNDSRFTEPGDMPARIREYCSGTGQPLPDSPAEVVRCVLESLALKHAQTVGLLGAAADETPGEIHMVGGGARNELLCQWTASASDMPVLAGPEEATLVGNLLVQTISLGEIGSVAEARELVRTSFPPKLYDPATSSAWEEARLRFADLAASDQRAAGAGT